MITDTVRIFSLNIGKQYAEDVARHLGMYVASHEERDFEDGEHKIRSLENVRGKEVYIIQALFSDDTMSVNDKLCRLLFLTGSLKDACASKITLIIPYLCYARKDRKTKDRDPVTTKYLAQIIEAVGTDHVITLDVHNLQAYQNSFHCFTDHLEAKMLFTDYFAELAANDDIVILSPDAGGMKRADAFSISLGKKIQKELPVIFMEKKRSKGIVTGSSLVGDVRNKTVIIIDDLISSGTTLSRAAQACKAFGALKVYAAATHGVFSEAANVNLQSDALDKIIITNSIPDFKINNDLIQKKIVILDTVPLIAECIRRLLTNESITELFH
ncbi:ribose-phosphate pyrophosphokinase [Sporocytophaga myxococcoides]|uniref:ribose-phosphate diphosphokinase n=1 Tax=Sporocytophaga myxococcoides TaxID=153721 RepID=A0A098LGN5_9BACT|nr:ribose-phosphate pyrophosphokinase [Sporocytophaga myxococcoides]GAL86151.1 ribose-phosphate pyrophosphokinase [Sporocytophaga myxococcoides]